MSFILLASATIWKKTARHQVGPISGRNFASEIDNFFYFYFSLYLGCLQRHATGVRGIIDKVNIPKVFHRELEAERMPLAADAKYSQH